MLAFLHQVLLHVADLHARLASGHNTPCLDCVTNQLLHIRETKRLLNDATAFGTCVVGLLVAGLVLCEALMIEGMATGHHRGRILHDLKADATLEPIWDGLVIDVVTGERNGFAHHHLPAFILIPIINRSRRISFDHMMSQKGGAVANS